MASVFPGVDEIPADAADRIRFLHMATFGASRQSAIDIFGIKAKSWRHQWINRQFNTPNMTDHAENVADIEVYFKPGLQWPSSLAGGLYHPAGSKIHTVRSLWKSFIEAEDQLRKRVTASLLSIFSLNQQFDSIGSRKNSFFSAGFANMIEANAFGNYRDILLGVSKSPAMGGYLTFAGNQKAAYDSEGNPTQLPDENYAREVLQLFSIGLFELKTNGQPKTDAEGNPIETYSQEDILNLARVFTGWNYPDGRIDVIANEPLVLDESQHSPEEKRFLGGVIPENTPGAQTLEMAIDIIFNHPNVGPFISKQLIQRLVMSNPSPDYIEAVAAKFNNNGSGVRGDMKAVIRRILTHPEAQNSTNLPGNQVFSGGKLREPMMRLTAIARAMGTRSTQAFFPIGKHPASLQGLGQAPMMPPSIFHFFRPGYAPAGSAISDLGEVAPEFQISSGAAIPSGINFINDAIYDLELLLDTELQPMIDLAPNAVDLVDYLCLLLTGDAISASDRAAIAEVVGNISINPNDEEQDLKRRMRGALRLIAAHPNFLVQY
jgi:uncharacterized protein (DUF1800 family)